MRAMTNVSSCAKESIQLLGQLKAAAMTYVSWTAGIMGRESAWLVRGTRRITKGRLRASSEFSLL